MLKIIVYSLILFMCNQSGLSAEQHVLQEIESNIEMAEEDLEDFGMVAESADYLFSDYLETAEVFIPAPKVKHETRANKSKLKNVHAKWTGEKFVFKDPKEPSVMLGIATFDAIDVTSILVPTLPNTKRVIRFRDVPVASKLMLEYGIPDEAVLRRQGGAVHLNVWIGGKLLKRIYIENERGWKRSEIDLGVLALLKKSVIVTFDITTSYSKSLPFGFQAELEF